MNIQLCDCERVLLEEIEHPEFTRDMVALTYAMAIQSEETVNWRKIHEAIIDRWSWSALDYIKRKAWNLVHEKMRATPGGGDCCSGHSSSSR